MVTQDLPGGEVRAAIKAFDSHLLVTGMQPMDALVDKAQSKTLFSLLLIGVFAVIAALLAIVGLYGVLATVVRQRTAEIGVRMALGAQPARIFRLVVGQGLRLTAAGIGVGLIVALTLTRAMTTMLVGITPTDPCDICLNGECFLINRGLRMLAARASCRESRPDCGTSRRMTIFCARTLSACELKVNSADLLANSLNGRLTPRYRKLTG